MIGESRTEKREISNKEYRGDMKEIDKKIKELMKEKKEILRKRQDPKVR